ncbi:MAG: M23 family metallopeptidase [Candidatus Latescibacterota bacterium]
MLCFILLPLLASAAPLSSAADEISWPIESGKAVTSSFGEPRPGRFHLGVDFSSGGVIGKPVYALGDGWISRASTSASGYGKMLELTLAKGGSAVYAHLSGFLPAIEDTLEALRHRRHSYEVNITFRPGEFPVRRGEVICRSGDSGSGPPHLHLELRDTENRPLNLLNHGLSAEDRIPPEIGGVVFIPLDRESAVDGSPLPQPYLSPSGEALYLTGNVGVAAEFVDRIVPSWYRLGVHRVELSVDSTTVFSKQYDRIPLSHSRFGGLDYLSGRRHGVGGTLSALFRRDSNPLDFYQGAGLPNIPPSGPAAPHTLHIRTWDLAGNMAKTSVPVVFGARPVITFGAFSPGGDLRIEGYTRSGELDRIEIETSAGSTRKSIRAIPVTGKSCRVSEQMGNTPATCRVTLIARDASRSLPATLRFNPSARTENTPEMMLSTEMHHDRVVVSVTSPEPLASLPELSFRYQGNADQKIEVVPQGVSSWVAGIPLTGDGQLSLEITARALDSGLREMTAEHILEFTRAAPSLDVNVSASDNRFSLTAPRGALYRPAPVAVDTAGVFQPEGLRPVSPAYRVEWGDEPIKGSFRAVFRLDANPPAKSLIYISGNGERWRPLSGQRRGKQFTASCSGSGLVGIFVDETDPRVEIISPRPNGVAGSRPTLRVRVEDRESGLAGSDSIHLIVDDRPVYGEYDPEADVVTYAFRKPLPPGTHTAIAGVIDRAGNRVVRSWNFTVR